MLIRAFSTHSTFIKLQLYFFYLFFALLCVASIHFVIIAVCAHRAQRTASENKEGENEVKKFIVLLTSGTVVWYGVLINTGALSFTSDTRTIIGMLRLIRVERIVQDI